MEKINIVKKWLQNSHHLCVELPKEVYDFISEKEPRLNFDDVNDIAFGITFLDWKEVSLNLNVLSSILITKYVKLFKSGVIGFEDW